MGGPTVRHPAPARRERTGAAACAHRLAALGGQYLSRLRHPVLPRRTRRCGRPRQIDFQAEGTTNANYGKPLDQYPVDTGRLRRVIEVVAERSGWAHKKPGHGRALGFAAHRSFLSYVAAVVEVEVDDQGRVR